MATGEHPRSLVELADRVAHVFSPWRRASGTEHMALLLYSLVRSTRPRTVVEYGPGYTTFFIARALQENACDAREEMERLLAKSGFVTADFALPSEPARIHTLVDHWMSSGDKSANVNPAFYLAAHAPRLYALEEQTGDTPYVESLTSLTAALGLADVVTITGGATAPLDGVPGEALPIDLAWNDHRDYRRFFTTLWPVLNPAGGTMVFHYTSSREYGADIEWMRAAREPFGDLEVLTVVEPHKLVQNGCTILRRTTAAQQDAPVNPDAVIASIKALRARQSTAGRAAAHPAHANADA